MQRAGTDESGFGLDFDARAQTVRVEAWGFWPIEVCSAFGKALVGACRNAAGVRRVEMETTRLKPLREEGEAAWATALAAMPGVGIEAIVVKCNSLTKLQLLRIASQSTAKSFVQFV